MRIRSPTMMHARNGEAIPYSAIPNHTFASARTPSRPIGARVSTFLFHTHTRRYPQKLWKSAREYGRSERANSRFFRAILPLRR